MKGKKKKNLIKCPIQTFEYFLLRQGKHLLY